MATRGATNLGKMWNYIFGAAGIFILILIFGVQLKVPVFRIINQIFSNTAAIAGVIVPMCFLSLALGVEVGNWLEYQLLKK